MKKNITKIVLASFVLCSTSLSASFAKEETTAGQDLVANNSDNTPTPIIYLKQHNVKLTYLGSEGGNDAYLGEAPGGKMQVFYLSADKTKVIPGVLFGFKGNEMIDETGLQIRAMQERIKAEKDKLAEQTQNAQKEKDRLSAAEEQLNNRQKIAEMAEQQLKQKTSDTSSNNTSDNKNSPTLPLNVADTSKDLPLTKTESVVSNVASANMSKYLSKMNAKDFVTGANNTAWFGVGVSNVPVLYIVADPRCPHCHKVWSQIKNRVFAGKLAVHIIMISGLPGSQEPAVQLLAKQYPGKAWLAGEGSTDNIPVSGSTKVGSPEYKKGQTYVQINNNYASEQKITGTPWMMYIGKDGNLYHYEGDTDIEDFLGAL